MMLNISNMAQMETNRNPSSNPMHQSHTPQTNNNSLQTF